MNRVVGKGALALAILTLTTGLSPTPAQADDVVLVAAGDIAQCGGTGPAATAKLVGDIPAAVAALGDNAYPHGSATDYAKCYGPTWGRFERRTRPVPGNHDYDTKDAAGYFGYFGSLAGPRGTGYYSYELGSWHIVALNSNCGELSCGAELRWLQADLVAHPALCTLAYWHHPRFSSGGDGDWTTMTPLWQALSDAGADVVLNGHAHVYERFAPQNPKGQSDPAHGIREFVVGTGGRSHDPLGRRQPHSEALNATTFGVLKLTLRAGRYSWQFLPAGGRFTDSGAGTCH